MEPPKGYLHKFRRSDVARKQILGDRRAFSFIRQKAAVVKGCLRGAVSARSVLMLDAGYETEFCAEFHRRRRHASAPHGAGLAGRGLCRI